MKRLFLMVALIFLASSISSASSDLSSYFERVYDNVTDSSLNSSLWNYTTSGTGNAVSENSEYIEILSANSYSGGPGTSGIVIFNSTNLTSLSNIKALKLKIDTYTSVTGGCNPLQSASVSVRIFGTEVILNSQGCGSSVLENNKTVILIGNWSNPSYYDLYLDDVFQSSFLATDNRISIDSRSASGLIGGASGTARARLYYVYYYGRNTISLVTPEDVTAFITNSTPIFNSTVTPIQDYNLTNATIYIWNSTGLFNSTTISYNTNSTVYPEWNITGFSLGTHYWNVYACILSFCNFDFYNNTFTVQSFSITNQTVDAEVYETANQTIQTTVTFTGNIFSIDADLIYNGVEFLGNASCSDNICTLLATFDTPLVSSGELESVNFYWNITFFDGSNSFIADTSTDPGSQNISRIHLESCNTTYSTMTYNFTAYDEEDLTKINTFDFRATFNYWLGAGTVYRNSSFDNSSISEKTLCISPTDQTYYTDAIIEYGNSSGGYVTRNYYFDGATFNNQVQNISLYLLASGDATTFIQEVLDENIQGLADAVIYTMRYYPGTDTYKTVQITKTASNGKTIGFYKTETVDYKHIIYHDGEVIINTDKGKVFPETTPYTLTFFASEEIATPWQSFESLENLIYSLTYNTTSKIFEFSYIDTSGAFAYGQLVVELEQYSNSSLSICDSTSIQSAVTITCNVSAYSGTVVAKAYIGRSSLSLVDILSIIIKAAKDAFGRWGLFLGMLIILAGYLVAIYDLNLGLIVGNTVLILINLTPLVNFPPITVWGITALTIIALVAINKR